MRSAILTALVLLCACSVKEDRAPCPCLLMLDIICPDKAKAETAELYVTSDDGFLWKDIVDLTRTRYSVQVPRAGLHVKAWTGTEGLASEHGLVIPEGRDCPKVYMHDSDLRVEGEFFEAEAVMRKNHCVMTLVTLGEGRINSDLRLKGNVAGYDAYGNPLPGDFGFLLDDGGLSEGYVAVLPRQTDASLTLVIDDRNGNSREFALGRYIVSSGYDWTAPDLEDVTVTLDYALTEIRLVIGGWESVYRYDVEI